MVFGGSKCFLSCEERCKLCLHYLSSGKCFLNTCYFTSDEDDFCSSDDCCYFRDINTVRHFIYSLDS